MRTTTSGESETSSRSESDSLGDQARSKRQSPEYISPRICIPVSALKRSQGTTGGNAIRIDTEPTSKCKGQTLTAQTTSGDRRSLFDRNTAISRPLLRFSSHPRLSYKYSIVISPVIRNHRVGKYVGRYRRPARPPSAPQRVDLMIKGRREFARPAEMQGRRHEATHQNRDPVGVTVGCTHFISRETTCTPDTRCRHRRPINKAAYLLQDKSPGNDLSRAVDALARGCR